MNSDTGGKVGGLAHTPSTAQRLASFGSGQSDAPAAITLRNVGGGKAYAVGIDFGYLLLRGYNNRQEGVSRSYANGFEPALDVLLRFLRNVFVEGEPSAVTLHPVPAGKPLAALITHDIDYTRSLRLTLDYTKAEKEQGIAGTYFVQTKYVRDWNDDVFFAGDAAPILQKLHAAGMEIGSHSVSHSRVFATFPLGDGGERYPDYKPSVRHEMLTINGSVLGELRVSRFLLQHLTPGLEVRSFRPGHLANPFVLPQALEATGYRYSSSVTANNALTHLPFRLTHDRAKTTQTAVFEFPVTIEDELPPRLDQRLDQALALADRIARYGGLFNVLIHTNVASDKLQFQHQLVEGLKQRHAWFGTMRELGDWWAARDALEVDVETSGEKRTLVLSTGKPIENLAVQLPDGWQIDPEATAPSLITGRTLLIPRIDSALRLNFVAR